MEAIHIGLLAPNCQSVSGGINCKIQTPQHLLREFVRQQAGLYGEVVGALGVEVHIGHAAANIAGAQFVAVSTAIPASNVEVVAAKEAEIPVLSRAALMF